MTLIEPRLTPIVMMKDFGAVATSPAEAWSRLLVDWEMVNPDRCCETEPVLLDALIATAAFSAILKLTFTLPVLEVIEIGTRAVAGER